MKPPRVDFQSALGRDIAAFVAYKRALGRKYLTEELDLRLLDRFLVSERLEAAATVTPDTIERFLASRLRRAPCGFNNLLGVVRRLFDWIVQQGRLPSSPVATRPRRVTASQLPYLFDAEQTRRLLDAAAALQDTSNAQLRGPTYNAIIALLAGLGLRVGEVTRLCGADYDRDRRVLTIRGTKFGKSRFVPLGPRLDSRLREYLQLAAARRGALGLEEPLFSFSDSRPINRHSINRVFRRLVADIDIETPAGTRPPCPHSLRHSFAVSSLLRWYRQGLDPSRRLLHLSTFLGHVQPESTAVYLTITDDLLREASMRFKPIAPPLGPPSSPR